MGPPSYDGLCTLNIKTRPHVAQQAKVNAFLLPVLLPEYLRVKLRPLAVYSFELLEVILNSMVGNGIHIKDS